jgi:hypothetical protein
MEKNQSKAHWNMNNFDLETKLRAVLVPERTEEYWDDFPSRVRRQLARPVWEERVRWDARPQWPWNGGLALACLLLFISFVPVFHSALKDERILGRDVERLPLGIQALMADEHGMQNLVTDSQ